MYVIFLSFYRPYITKKEKKRKEEKGVTVITSNKIAFMLNHIIICSRINKPLIGIRSRGCIEIEKKSKSVFPKELSLGEIFCANKKHDKHISA